MKSKILSAFAKIAFILAAIQFALFALGMLFRWGAKERSPVVDTVTVREPGHEVANIAFQLAPYLLLAALVGLGFYLRWLSKKFQTR